MRTEYVYALVDPRSNLPFYIGRSCWPEDRVYQHLSNMASAPVKAWIAEIRTAGMEPTWGVLEKTEDPRTAECQWVQRCVAQGIPLANSFKVNRYRVGLDVDLDQPIVLTPRKVEVPTVVSKNGRQSQIVINGIPLDYISRMQAVADKLSGPRPPRLKRVYAEAIRALLDSDDCPNIRGQPQSSNESGAQKIVWVPTELLDRLDACCGSMIFKNSFIITAISRYLTSKGE